MTSGQVAITGARGWIGGHLVRRLRERGLNVTCLSHDLPASDVASVVGSSRVVVHAGGAYSNSRSDLVEGNIEQAVAVAKGCSRVDNCVVFLSSVKVYGWAAADGQMCGEEAPTCGADNFSAAKRIVEELFARAARRSVVLRIANVYGRGVPAKYAVGTMLEGARRRGRVTLDCTGQSRRDFVHLDDVLRVLESVVASCLGADGDAGAEVYNVAGGRLVTLEAVAGVFRDVLGAQVETRGGRVVSSPAFRNSKVISAGHIPSFIDPLSGIRSLLEEWREDPWEVPESC